MKFFLSYFVKVTKGMTKETSIPKKVGPFVFFHAKNMMNSYSAIWFLVLWIILSKNLFRLTKRSFNVLIKMLPNEA